MRKIKFRIWDQENKKFLDYDDEVEYSFGIIFDDISVFEHDLINDDENEMDNVVIQQFTGLKDKNGKEIYEGDFVGLKFVKQKQEDVGIYQVIYCDKAAAFRLKTIRKNHLAKNDKDCFNIGKYDKICVVVGNMFENEDLLI